MHGPDCLRERKRAFADTLSPEIEETSVTGKDCKLGGGPSEGLVDWALIAPFAKSLIWIWHI